MPLSVPTYGPGLSPMCSPWSREGAQSNNAYQLGNLAAGTHPAANRAFYFPVVLPRIGTAYKLWWSNGTTASTNNIQVGVYADTGSSKPGAAIVRGTSTLAANASVVQFDDITDTQMGPALVWFAIWCNGTTTTLRRGTGARLSRGYEESALAGGLPATATPVAISTSYLPVFGVQFRSSP